MKILTIIGARPQFIKAAALSREINKYPTLEEVIVHTGQHFDANMSDIFFEEMEIPKPHYNLNIYGLSHGAMTGQMLEGIEKIILKESPDLVMVYGDTNSTIAGALAAKKLHVKVAHVEAGLRSFNMQMPEEINRILTDRISDWLFCPTEAAIENLRNEGFERFDAEIIKTGDVMEDTARYYADKAEVNSTILSIQKLINVKFILGTLHRAENTDNIQNLKKIITAFNEINKSIKVVMPVHPRTQKIIKDSKIAVDFQTFEPVGYFDMLMLLKNCSLVVTDSGGLQKEAYFFRKYCVTTREQTEWVELVDNDYNVVCGSNTQLICKTVDNLMDKEYPKLTDLYGNGNACSNIVNFILFSLQNRN